MPAHAHALPHARTCPRTRTQVHPEGLAKIRSCGALIRCLQTLKEGNLEFLTVDSHTIVTEHPMAGVRVGGAHAGACLWAGSG